MPKNTFRYTTKKMLTQKRSLNPTLYPVTKLTIRTANKAAKFANQTDRGRKTDYRPPSAAASPQELIANKTNTRGGRNFVRTGAERRKRRGERQRRSPEEIN